MNNGKNSGKFTDRVCEDARRKFNDKMMNSVMRDLVVISYAEFAAGAPDTLASYRRNELGGGAPGALVARLENELRGRATAVVEVAGGWAMGIATITEDADWIAFGNAGYGENGWEWQIGTIENAIFYALAKFAEAENK